MYSAIKSEVNLGKTHMENSTATLETKKPAQGLAWILVVVALAVSATVMITYFIQFDGPLSDKQGVWGEFGDFVGGVLNPIFGFFSLIGLLLTIAQNRTAIESARAELELSRSALNLAKQELEALKNAHHAEQVQNEERNAEETLFRTLELHQQTVDALIYLGGGEKLKGESAVKKFANTVYNSTERSGAIMYGGNVAEAEMEAYRKYIRDTEYGTALSRIWTILSCIPPLFKKLPSTDHDFYANLIRSQMSVEEMKLFDVEHHLHDNSSPVHMAWMIIRNPMLAA